GDLGARGDVLVARPSDVVGGVADAKDGVEQQLDAAAAGADYEVGARYGVGETLPRAGAHLLDSQQQHDADGDGKDRQGGSEPAVAQRLQSQTQDDHGPAPCRQVAISSSRITWSKRGARLSSWLTMIRVAPASATSAKRRSRNAAWRLRSSAEVGTL